MTDTTTETRASKAEKTRQTVLEAARKIFTEKGYADTTIRDIATEANRSTGSVFTHWDTKRDLFFCVFGHWPLDGAFASMAAQIIQHAAKDADVTQSSQSLWADLTNGQYFDQDPV